MIVLLLSLMFGLYPIESDKKTSYPFSEFIDTHYLRYHFDNEDYSHPVSGTEGKRLSLLERKKAILYSYFELQKSKYSDSYLELLDRIEYIVRDLAANYPQNEEPLLTWEDFKQEYKKLGLTKLPLIGTGSLANPKDLMQILPEKRKSEPVIGFGGKRMFKLRSPSNEHRGLPSKGFDEEVANLAVEEQKGVPLYDVRNLYNGVIFDIKISEVETLQKERSDYHLKKVPYIKVASLFDNPVTVRHAYVLINNSKCDKEIKPHLNYLNLVIESFDDGNLDQQDLIRLFSETTYLADGKTTIDKWLEAEVKVYYQISLIIRPIILQHVESIENFT